MALGARAALAAPRLFVELDYEPDATLSGCPTEGAFKAMVEQQLGYDPVRSPSDRKIIARASAVAAGVRGVVEWYDATGALSGQRELSSESAECAALARAMSFAIAVQIQLLTEEAEAEAARDAELAETAGPNPPKPPAPGANVATAQAERDAAASPARSSEGTPAWRFSLGAGPTVGFGLAPETVFEARVFVAAEYDGLSVEAGGEGSLTSRHDTDSGQGFEQSVAFGSLAGCAALRPISTCVVGKLGRLGVEGYGVDDPHTDSGLVSQLGLRLALGGSLSGPWLGALRAEALASLAPWEVTLDERSVWKTPLFSLGVGADLAVLFQ
ncbi:MAG TPA: hypothetical protein VFZ53_00885 [Polyangiaceae bacterium]